MLLTASGVTPYIDLLVGLLVPINMLIGRSPNILLLIGRSPTILILIGRPSTIQLLIGRFPAILSLIGLLVLLPGLKLCFGVVLLLVNVLQLLQPRVLPQVVLLYNTIIININENINKCTGRSVV